MTHEEAVNGWSSMLSVLGSEKQTDLCPREIDQEVDEFLEDLGFDHLSILVMTTNVSYIPPGTGKTTTLLNMVTIILAKVYIVHCFLAFTRKQPTKPKKSSV